MVESETKPSSKITTGINIMENCLREKKTLSSGSQTQTFPSKKHDKVMNVENESIVIFRSRGITLDNSALMLDDPVRPETVEVTLIQTDLHSKVSSLQHESDAFFLDSN